VPISEYVKKLRAQIGRGLLLLPGVAAVVRDEAGRVLLERRSDDGRWDLPAGAIDPGESPAQALVREVFEETGLLVRPERLLGVFGGAGSRFCYPNGDEVEYTDLLFECRITGGDLTPHDGEASELRFFAPEELPELPPFPRAVLLAPPGAPPYFEWQEAWVHGLGPGSAPRPK
jgi:8-oxo-dGTP pyrophosphatase MutT (NUDIX family)